MNYKLKKLVKNLGEVLECHIKTLVFFAKKRQSMRQKTGGGTTTPPIGCSVLCEILYLKDLTKVYNRHIIDIAIQKEVFCEKSKNASNITK